MSNGGLVILSKADRAKLASHYQAVCDAGRKAQLSDYYPPRPDPAPERARRWRGLSVMARR